MNRSALTVERALWWGPGLVLVLVLAVAPLLFTDFYLSQVITKALWLGIAAASLIFLAAYGGMVSLAQVGLYGVAGMTYANLVLADGGSSAAWNPWLHVIARMALAQKNPARRCGGAPDQFDQPSHRGWWPAPGGGA